VSEVIQASNQAPPSAFSLDDELTAEVLRQIWIARPDLAVLLASGVNATSDEELTDLGMLITAEDRALVGGIVQKVLVQHGRFLNPEGSPA
jgi:hypothetical protein